MSYGLPIFGWMGRPTRNDSHVGWFHITNRGARRYDTFITESDRRAFFGAVARFSSKLGIEVVAICLMANHYHLIVRCPVGNASSMMRCVGASYTRHFNRAHGFTGPLNGHRFDSEVLDDDAYLVTATRYVHRNPLEVGIDIASHPWSSYSAYATEGSRSVGGLPISHDIPLRLAGGRAKYIAFVEQDLPTDKAPFSAGVRTYGPTQRTAPSLAEIRAAVKVAAAGGPLGIPGARAQARLRHLEALLAADRGAHSLDEIAGWHGFGSKSTVYSAIRSARQRIAEDPAMADTAAHAVNILKAPKTP